MVYVRVSLPQQCLSATCLSAMASPGPEMALCATYPTVPKMTLIGISIQGVNVRWRREEGGWVGGEGQFRPSVSSQTDWHGVQLCCGLSGGGIGGYSRRWKGWEFKATARGPHSRHTKGCPQNAPHSLSPLSLSRFAPPPTPPSERIPGVPPRSHTNTQTDTHTQAGNAGKETGQTVYGTDLVASVHSLEQNPAAGGGENGGPRASGVPGIQREEKRNHSPDSNNLKGKAVWRARPRLRTQQLFL